MATEPITRIAPQPKFSREKKFYLKIFAILGVVLIVILVAKLWEHHKIDNDLRRQAKELSVLEQVNKDEKEALERIENAGKTPASAPASTGK
ncbi:MAG: hypothetical protein LBP75_02775 [Planctomycetota bacterium]|jgi:hypothetical protein|nr:hypothetical protein [Planctomycetota bacterium]